MDIVNIISIVVGVVLALNILTISLMWLRFHTRILDKVNEKTLNIILFVLGMLGGFIGIFIGIETVGYDTENRLFGKWLKRVVVLEIAIAVCIIASQYM